MVTTEILSQLKMPEYVTIKVTFEVELSMEEIRDIGDSSYDFWSIIVDHTPEPTVKVINTDKRKK